MEHSEKYVNLLTNAGFKAVFGDCLSRYEFANAASKVFGPKTIILNSLKHSGAHTEQFENDEIERLLRASEIAGFGENKQLNYEHDLYYSREKGREEGLKEGLEKGKAEGRAEGKVEVAKSLLAMGLPIEQVAQATGIAIEDLKALTAE